MRIEELKKEDVERICKFLAPKLNNDALFKFLCPDKEKRQGFIEAYFRYNLPHWAEHGALFCDEDLNALVVLSNPRFFTEKFKGRGAKRMKHFKGSSTMMLYYRGNISYIAHLVAPKGKGVRILAVFTEGDNNEVVSELVDEACALSKEANFTLLYETLSRRRIDDMKKKGFITAYQRQLGSTKYLETTMMYSE